MNNHNGQAEEIIVYDIDDNQVTVTDANGVALTETAAGIVQPWAP